MGRRHRAMRFMPGFYVFPGGRVDPIDRESSGFQESLCPPPAGVDKTTHCRLITFARAALRESYEETGLLLSSAAPVPQGRPSNVDLADIDVWRAYRRAETIPAFDALRLIARAITPTSSPMRFHTRFFGADGDLARGTLSGDGELEDLHWVRLSDTRKLKISEVTLAVLREALAHRKARDEGRPAALFHWVGAKEWPRFRRDADPAGLDLAAVPAMLPG